MKLSKFFMFDFLIAPWIIRILYFIAQIVITISFLTRAFNFGPLGYYGSPLGIFFMSFLFFIGASLGIRLISEFLILQFQICENTSQLRRLLENKNANLTTPNKDEAEGGTIKEVLFCGHCGEKQENTTAGDICTNCGKEL